MLSYGTDRADIFRRSGIDQLTTSLGQEPGGGLAVMPDGFMVGPRPQIISLAAHNNECAVSGLNMIASRLREGAIRVKQLQRLAGHRGFYVDEFAAGFAVRPFGH